jgi:hypothetical protein
MIQALFGCFLTLRCRIRRRSWLMTKKQVDHAECDRWHGEEIHGRNRFPMVSKEGKPVLGRDRPWRSFHPTRNGSLGKIKTEHAEFPMYPRAPQVGFSATIRKINSRTSFGVCFLPTYLRTLEISRQYISTASCWRSTRFSKTRFLRLRERRIRSRIQRKSRLNMARSYTRSTIGIPVVSC